MGASVAGMEKTKKRKRDEDRLALWGGGEWGQVMEGLASHEYFSFYLSVV